MRAAPLLLLALAAPTLAASSLAADRPRVLTLDEALRTAETQQPQLREAQAGTRAALARADQARSSLFPQVNGNGAYQRSTANFTARPGSVPSQFSQAAGGSWDTFNYFNFGLSASQLLYDFGGSNSRWHAAQATAASQQAGEHTTDQLVRYSVRSAYFTARAAKGLVTVAKETLANEEKHLQQVEGFVEVGTKPEIDLAQARTDRANAEVLLINAQNGYETAKALLNQAMGVEEPTDYDVADETLPPVPGEDQDTAPLLDEALRGRPEFVALTHQVRAQQLTVRSIQGELWPTLGVSTGFTDAGGQFSNLAWNWSGAISLSVPIFQGGITRAQVREAQATLASLEAEGDALRQQVRVEVEQARLAVRAAKASLGAASEALVNAQEQLRLAEGRYETGVGSIIELGDAQVALTAAAQQKVQAEYNLSTARAQLLKALGRS
jgi:outer membrane protein